MGYLAWAVASGLAVAAGWLFKELFWDRIKEQLKPSIDGFVIRWLVRFRLMEPPGSGPQSAAPEPEYGSGVYQDIFWRWRWGISPVGHRIPLDMAPFCMMCGTEMHRAEREGAPRCLYFCPCALSVDAPGGFDLFEANVARSISRDFIMGVVPDRPPFEIS